MGRAAGQEVAATGGKANFMGSDASDTGAVHAAVAGVADRWGRIDMLFNHAGSNIVKPLHETTNADCDRLMAINVRSAFVTGREVVAHMLDDGGGSIVIASSIGGEKGFALESLYCMTKGAVLQLARSIAAKYRDRVIRANAVCPAFVKTDHGLREIKELDGLDQQWNESDLAAAKGRICEPEDVAAAAIFLASDEASFINGTPLYVDNGWNAKG